MLIGVSVREELQLMLMLIVLFAYVYHSGYFRQFMGACGLPAQECAQRATFAEMYILGGPPGLSM